MNKAELEAAYRAKRHDYLALAERIEPLLIDLLKNDAISFHIVEARAKEIESFVEKASRPGKSYVDPFEEIDDLCGCRIILYYIDDIKRVSELLQKEFDVKEIVTSHQPDELEVDKFGYLSLHLIATLKENRTMLPEWRHSADLKFEIQVRTVIQHAWSAVSHALQYKRETAVPSKIRRRLFRIAGLFELADEEFLAIKDARVKLEKKTKEEVASDSKNVAISSISIQAAIEGWEKYPLAVERAVASGFSDDAELDEGITFVPDIYDLTVKAGIKNISEIEDLVSKVPSQQFFRKVRSAYLESSIVGVSREFLFFVVLTKHLGQHLSAHDMIENGWGETLIDDFIRAVDSSRKD